MDSKAIPILKDIKNLTGIESYEEILNRALTVMYWVARQDHRGRMVVSLDESTRTYEPLKFVRAERAAATAAVDLSELCASEDSEIYKFIGDGWVLLFPTDVQATKLVDFPTERSQVCRENLAKLEDQLSRVPKVMGLTFGMDHGDVIRLVMNGKPEYIGRALNIASRLQGKVKEIAPEGYKALMSRRIPGSAAWALEAYTPPPKPATPDLLGAYSRLG
jgi:class 3 adenylate cyclase